MHFEGNEERQLLLAELLQFLSASGVHVRSVGAENDPEIEVEGCEGDLIHTAEWAQLRGIDQASVKALFDGCPCDCTVLMDLIDGRVWDTRPN